MHIESPRRSRVTSPRRSHVTSPRRSRVNGSRRGHSYTIGSHSGRRFPAREVPASGGRWRSHDGWRSDSTLPRPPRPLSGARAAHHGRRALSYTLPRHRDRRTRLARSTLLEPEARQRRVARARHHDPIRPVPAGRVVVGIIVNDHPELQARVPVRIPRAVGTESMALIAEEPGILVSAPDTVGNVIQPVIHVFPIGNKSSHVIIHGDVGIRIHRATDS